MSDGGRCPARPCLWALAVGALSVLIVQSAQGNFGRNVRVNQAGDGHGQAAPRVAVGPEGTLYAAWEDWRHGTGSIYLARSTDGGAHPDRTGVQQLPDLAYDYDIHHAVTADGGATFTAPVRVNDDPPGEIYTQESVCAAGLPAGGAAVVWMMTGGRAQRAGFVKVD